MINTPPCVPPGDTALPIGEERGQLPPFSEGSFPVAGACATQTQQTPRPLHQEKSSSRTQQRRLEELMRTYQRQGARTSKEAACEGHLQKIIITPACITNENLCAEHSTVLLFRGGVSSTRTLPRSAARPNNGSVESTASPRLHGSNRKRGREEPTRTGWEVEDKVEERNADWTGAIVDADASEGKMALVTPSKSRATDVIVEYATETDEPPNSFS